jgi:hypothetical protein
MPRNGTTGEMTPLIPAIPSVEPARTICVFVLSTAIVLTERLANCAAPYGPAQVFPESVDL